MHHHSRWWGAFVFLTALVLFAFVVPTQAQGTDPIRINFQASGSPPAGYLIDTGEPFGPRTGANQGSGLSYGWRANSDDAPVDMNSQARNRGGTSLTQTLIHMDHPSTPPTGYWEIALANGTYNVTVTVGDPSIGSDPTNHVITGDEQVILSGFVPTQSNLNTTATGTVIVNDGALTIQQGAGGQNTKINAIEIEAVEATNNPRINVTSPVDGETGVSINTSISASVILPTPGAGVNESSLSSTTVRLIELDGNGNELGQIPWVSLNSTAGLDAISSTPQALQPFTSYKWIVDGVTDETGTPFDYFEMTFTTGGSGSQVADVRFTSTDTGYSSLFTSIAIGPDFRLYATSIYGELHIWDIDENTGDISNERTFSPSPITGRALIGLEFDPNSTPSNPIVWVTHNQGVQTLGGGGDHFTGAIAVMNVQNHDTAQESWTAQDMVVGLPRSHKDHLTNSLELGPDGALYLTQGSISAMGDIDSPWNFEPETLLSAAILRVDRADLLSRPANELPIDVTTGEPDSNGNLYNGNLDSGTFLPNYGLNDPALANLYDPSAPGAPVTLYATGLRNAYDLLWHSNGHLYSATNGSASGGRSPATPANYASLPQCQERIDGQPYTGPVVPERIAPPTQLDLFFKVEQNKYYGHPNPTRCEWVLNGGDPNYSVVARVSQYPDGTEPDPNYGGVAYDFGTGKSPNGTIEYVSNTFGGALQNTIMIVRYSSGDDILVFDVDSNGDFVQNSARSLVDENGNVLTFNSPLDIIEDPRNGNLYVSAYQGSRIFLLKPFGSAPTPEPNIQVVTDTRIFSDDVANSAPSPAQTIVVQNTGTTTLNLSNVTLGGSDSGEFTIQNAPSSVAPNTSELITVAFDPTSDGVKAATLIIGSNDPDTGLVNIPLRGLAAVGLGGSNEPSLQRIFDTFELGVDAGDSNPATNIINTPDYNALIGDEIDAQAFQKAGSGPVTLELLAVYGPTANNPVVNVGWYSTGSPNTAAQVFSVSNSPAVNGQSLNPPTTGALSFDPGDGRFGFYSEWPFFSNRRLYSEDALNTFNGNIPHHVRVYPLPGEANAYIIATEEHISGFDYQDVVFIARNIQPSQVASGDIRVENPTWATLNAQNIPELAYLNRWLTMSRINNFTGHEFSDFATVRIHNDGATPLVINGLTISDTSEFDLPNNEDANLPLTIAPGNSYDLDVQFVESSGGKGIRQRTLTINSSDADEPNIVITLAGSYMTNPEGGSEISADQIADAFGISPDSQDRNLIPLSSQYLARYEEVLSFRWQRADTAKPLYVRQLAAFHGCFNSDGFGISGSGGFSHDGDYCQSLLPLKNGTTVPAEQLYNSTNNTFTIQAAGYHTNRCQNIINSGEVCMVHGMRLWPVYNNEGVLVPNTYYAIQDFVGPVDENKGCGAGSANCDFNDNVYLITNLEPVTMPDPALSLALAVDDPDIGLGDTVTFTLDVSNDQVFDAESVQVNSTLPGALSLTGATIDGQTCATASNDLSCNLPVLSGKATTQVVVTATGATAATTVNATFDVTTGSFSDSATSEGISIFDPANEPGTITIVKQASPESDAEFSFTGDLGSFTLSDTGLAVGGDSISINFQNPNPDPAAPAPYLPDFGQAFGDRGNDLEYGWVIPGTNTPLDLSVGGNNPGNGRDRETVSDPILDTIFHMQYDDVNGTNGTPAEGAWEISLPDGDYTVEVTVGDPDVDGSAEDYPTHVINVEGQPLVTGFAPGNTPEGSAGRHLTESGTFTVSDGRLTLDAIGGFNTKIQAVVITPLAQPNTVSFDVLPGTYVVTENLGTAWLLDSLVCDDSDSTANGTTATIILSGGEDVTCTFTNVSNVLNQSPSFASNPPTDGVVGVEYVYNMTATDPENNEVIFTIDSAPAWLSISSSVNSTATLSGTPPAAGTFDVTLIANDDLSPAAEQSFQIIVSEPANNCAPISELPCDQIATALPFVVEWNSSEGGLANTGFTMVDPPSARLSADDPVYNTDVPGFEPGQLTVANGTLTIASNKGIQYAQPSGPGTTSTETNSQINALGVGFDAGQLPFTVETTINGLDFTTSTGNNSQQAGIWFGLNEDNYIKLVVGRTGTNAARVELASETTETGSLVFTSLATGNNAIGSLNTKDVTLKLIVEEGPTPGTYIATGFYSVDGGAETQITANTLTVPTGFITGADHDSNVGTDPLSYAGVFATHRRATDSFNAVFENFSISTEATPEPGSLTVVLDSVPDSAQVFNYTVTGPNTNAAGQLLDDGATGVGNTTFGVSVNFQNDAGATPAGFEKDFGQGFGDRGNGFNYGWIEQAGVPTGTSTPLDISVGGSQGNGRDRDNGGVAQELDTLMHMQYGDITNPTNGNPTAAAWEIAVPNGDYDVTVSVGDGSVDSAGDAPTHVINVEGQSLIGGFQPTGSAGSLTRFTQATGTFTVSDGLLTVDAIGGFNTKINTITVQGVSTGSTGNNSFELASLEPGTYTITQDQPTDWALTSVVCDGQTLSGPSVQVTVVSGEALTCTFTNEEVINQAPSFAGTPVEDGITGEVYAYDFTVSDPENDSLTVGGSFPSWLTLNDNGGNSYTLTGTPTAANTYIVSLTLNDGSNPAVTQDFSITVEDPAPTFCAPISELPCDQIATALPFVVEWDSSEGGLADTGFTMVDPPSERLTADAPVYNTDVPGFEPGQLTVANGTLTIASNKGIQYAQPTGPGETSTDTNSQINALGVGFDAGQLPFTVETTINGLDFTPSNGNNFQQTGLWFGLDEDNYIKLVVGRTGTNAGRVELASETDETGSLAFTTLQTSANAITDLNTKDVTLKLVIEEGPTPGTYIATGFYSVDGSAETQVTANTLTVPAGFIDGTDHDSDGITAPLSYAGVFATHRRATSSYNAVFENFSISTEGTGPVNTAPTAIADSITTDEGNAVSITLTGSDAENDPLTFAVDDSSIANGVLDVSNLPQVTYIPDVNFFGTETFTFTVNDGEFTSAPATVEITVDPVNDAPAAVAQFVVVEENGSVVITLMGMDIENDPLTFAVATGPANGALSAISGNEVTYTPNADFFGSDSFTFVANDGTLDSAPATVSITVEEVNEAPVALAQSVTVDENGSVVITLEGSDADSDPLTFAIDSGPANGALSAISGNEVTYTPNADYFGSDSFTFTANDGTLDSAPATVSITVEEVNEAPVALAQSVSVDENGSVVITLEGSDADSDPLTFAIDSGPANGSLSALSGNQVTYTPTADFFGSDSFTFVANDGTLDSAPATVSITVEEVNEAPVALAQSVTVDENGSVVITLEGSDADSDPLTFAIDSSPANGALSAISGNEVTYTPNADFFGSDSFTFVANDGTLDSAPATVSITVEEVNEAPVALAQSVTVDENGSVVITLAGSDADSDPLTFAIDSSPANGALSAISGNQVTYTPNADFFGSDSFTFVANDGTLDSAPATVSITVNEVIEVVGEVIRINAGGPAITTTGGKQWQADTYFVGGKTGTFANPIAGTDDDTLYISERSSTADITASFAYEIPVAASGTHTVRLHFAEIWWIIEGATGNRAAGPGQRVFDVVIEGQTVLDEFDITDEVGALTALTKTFTVEVNDGVLNIDFPGATVNRPQLAGIEVFGPNAPVNNAPVANAQNVSVDENGSVVITLTGSDADNDGLTFAVANGPANGSLSAINGNEVTYTPNADFFGSDSFTFVANDGSLTSAPATVSITVDPVNEAPVALAQSVSVDENGSVVITLAGSDADNDALTFAVANGPANGSLSAVSGNEVTYTPNADFFGSDSFTFTAFDGSLTSAPATVSITVNEVVEVVGEVIRINAGGPAVTTDAGTQWQADQYFDTGNANPLATAINGNTDEDQIYFTERSATADNTGFAYAIPVATNGTHTVNLHFAELWWVGGPGRGSAGVGKRVFDVAMEGQTVLNNFDPTAAAGAPLTAHVESFTVEVTDGVLNITFPTADVNRPTLSGIEVFGPNVTTPVNTAPVANDQSVSVEENGSILVTLTGTDADNDTLTYSIVDGPANGFLSTLNGDEITYTPTPGYTGSDSFTFVANDGTEDSAVATVSITVTPETVETACALVQEAENGLLTGDMQTGTDGSVTYVHAPNGTGNTYGTPSAEHRASYCVDVDVPGLYKVIAHTWAPNGNDDSFWVGFNNTNWALWDIPQNNQYLPAEVSARNGANPNLFELTAGENELIFAMREDGTRLDKFEVVLVEPFAVPGVCGPLAQEAEDGLLAGSFVAGVDGNITYVHAPEGTGSNFSGPSQDGYVSFCVDAAAAGTYTLQGWVYGSNFGEDNSFFVTVNNEGPYLWDTVMNTSYLPDFVSERFGDDPVTFNLNAGENIVTFYLREDGTRLDRFEFIPTGQNLDFAVDALILMDADTMTPVATLEDGAELQMADLAGRNLMIQAVTSGEAAADTVNGLTPPQMVIFNVDSDATDEETEAAMTAGQIAWTPVVGAHSADATPYLAGEVGLPKSVQFTVVDGSSTANPTTPEPTTNSLTVEPVDVLGSAVEGPEPLDTSEVEAAVEGPGN